MSALFGEGFGRFTLRTEKFILPLRRVKARRRRPRQHDEMANLIFRWVWTGLNAQVWLPDALARKPDSTLEEIALFPLDPYPHQIAPSRQRRRYRSCRARRGRLDAAGFEGLILCMGADSNHVGNRT